MGCAAVDMKRELKGLTWVGVGVGIKYQNQTATL